MTSYRLGYAIQFQAVLEGRVDLIALVDVEVFESVIESGSREDGSTTEDGDER